MNKIYSTLIVIFFFNTLQAQSWVWKQAYGFSHTDEGKSITTDKAGNIYSVGHYTDSIAFQQASLDTTNGFLLKQLPNGNVVWAHRLINADVEQITCDNQNNIYIAGLYYTQAVIGGMPVTGDPGNNNLFIAKLDSLGNAIWVNGEITINGGDVADIGVDSLFNVFITGYFNAYLYIGNDTLLSCSKDAYMAKIDNGGNISWFKIIQSCGKDAGKGLAIDSYGDVYFTGSAGGNADTVMLDNYYLPPTNRYYLAKISNSGNVLWFQGDSHSDGKDVAVNTNDEIFVAGCFAGTTYFGNDTISSLGYDQFVNKMDVNGNVIWSKHSIALVATTYVEQVKIECDSSSNFYILNSFRGNVIFDSININATSYVFSIQKYDVNGNVLFIKPVQGNYFQLNDIALDNSTNIYVVGEMGWINSSGNDYIVFDADTLFSFGGYDIAIAKLSYLKPTGVNKVYNNNLNLAIYPNPFTSKFLLTVLTQDKKQIDITIQNVLGQVVFTERENYLLDTYSKEIDLSFFADGVYLVRVTTDGEQIVRKIVKQKSSR